MRTNPEKYKYWVLFTKQNSGKKNEQGISWGKLIDVVSSIKPQQIKEIKFYHPDAPCGTGHVDGTTMLELWKIVDKRKTAKTAV